MAELPQITESGTFRPPPVARVPEPQVGAALADESSRLSFIAAQARRDEEVGKVSNAIGNFMLQRDDIAKKLSTVSDPDGYLNDYRDATNAAYQNIVKQFPAGPMQDRLAGELKIHLGEGLYQATQRSTALAVKAGQDSLNTALKTWSPIAATAADPRDRSMALNNAHGLIYGNKYTTDDEKAQQWQKWQHDTQLTGWQERVANNDPTVAMDLQALGSSPFNRNAPFATKGPWTTQLAPADESAFRQWVTANKVPFNPDGSNQDYDMRGYWKDVASKGQNQTAINAADQKLHFPDTYKTPYHASFSDESKYAKPGTPFKWQGETLVDQRSGNAVYQTGQPEDSLILPEEREKLLNQAISQSTYAYRTNEAAAHAQQAQAETAIQQLQAQGKPVTAALEDYGAHFGNDGGFYRRMTGHPFQQSMPGVRDAFDTAVKQATTPEELDAITERAAIAQETGQMSAKDASIVSLTAGHAKTAQGQASRVAEGKGWEELRDRWFPPVSPMTASMARFAPKISAASMKDDYDLALKDHKGNVAAAQKEVNDKYRLLVGGSSGGAFGKLTSGPVPAAPAAPAGTH